MLAAFTASAFAQDDPGRGLHGTYGLSYQYVQESDVATNIGDIDVGTLDTHTVLFDLELVLSDRWEFYLGLPFVTKRYNGDSPHDPGTLEFDSGEPFIDDGQFHSDFQDLVFGLRYTLLDTTRVRVQPFIGAGLPTNDYPVFAHAAVGQNLRRLDVGARFDYLPPLSDFAYSLWVTRAFVESVEGVNVDYWRIDGEVAYFVNSKLALRAFVLTRHGNGLEFPDDFPPPRENVHWYEHEGLLAREYVVAGIGAEWSLTARNRLTTSVLTGLHEKYIHKLDYGITVGLSRDF